MYNSGTIQGAEETFHYKSRVERVKEYVLGNLAGDLSIEAVAEKFGLSTSALRHIFKKHTGRPYYQYVQEMRMNKAYELIARKGERIQQAMYATGYKYRSSFNKAFKKRFNHPPGYFSK
jgi:AraC-like DNA-binding protein